MTVVTLNGEEVAIANVDGAYFAFGNICPHEGGPLNEGVLDGARVTCPWHFTVFDVKTGKPIEGVTDDPVPSYELRLAGDEIQIRKR
jgi:nitrite reductase/ring-hydroxylating ferredoxin subunit